MNYTNNYIYFYHLEKYCILPSYPETISDSMTTTFTSTNALSRSAPVFSYQHSGPRQVNITLQLHRDMMNDMNKNVSNLKSNVVPFSNDDYVDTLLKYLQAAALPKYQTYSSGSKSVIPPMIAVRFGNEIFIKGVISSNINVVYKKPILVGEKYALVEVTFSVSETDPYDALSVVNEGSFRGMTRSFKSGLFNDNYSGSYNQSAASNQNYSTSSALTDDIVINKKHVSYRVYR